MLDVSYTTLTRTESGSARQLPRPIKEALDEVDLGEEDMSGQDMAESYEDWREEHSEELRKEFEGGQN